MIINGLWNEGRRTLYLTYTEYGGNAMWCFINRCSPYQIGNPYLSPANYHLAVF